MDIVNAARFIGGNLAVGVDKALEWETMIENCFRERPAELALLFCCKLSLREIPPDVFFFKTEDNELRPFRDAIVSAC